jgi:hypothetical protein
MEFTPVRITRPCANCGLTFDAGLDDDPYCALRCHDEAKAVRYARRQYAKYGLGSVPEDVTYAIGIKVAHALAGGYDRRARTIPADARLAVRERDGERCQMCGAAGEEIDHISGSSPDPANLRLLCGPCHREVTSSRLVPIDDPATLARRDVMFERAMSPSPLRPCDADEWASSWRAWVRANTTTAPID